MKFELAKPQKGNSGWPSLISGITKVGEDNGKPFPPEKLAQMRSVISSTIKPRFPSRTYKANHQTKAGKLVTWIWLDEDLEEEITIKQIRHGN